MASIGEDWGCFSEASLANDQVTMEVAVATETWSYKTSIAKKSGIWIN